MSNFLTDVKGYLNNRLSGRVTTNIKQVENSLKIINSIAPPPDDNFWLLWYADYLTYRLKFYKTARFVPGRFIRKKMKINSKQ